MVTAKEARVQSLLKQSEGLEKEMNSIEAKIIKAIVKGKTYVVIKELSEVAEQQLRKLDYDVHRGKDGIHTGINW